MLNHIQRPTFELPRKNEAIVPVAKTMTYLVVDREAMKDATHYRVITTKATVACECPKCGGPRGEPESRNFYDDGDTYTANVWTNPCGHIDMYDDVLKEAKSFKLDEYQAKLDARFLQETTSRVVSLPDPKEALRRLQGAPTTKEALKPTRRL